MDRYLFRGKRIDERIESGEWSEGDLIRLQPNRYGISINPNRASTMPLWEYIRRFTREIDPATIGQCTGLKDKNGKLIFENDVCKFIYGGFKRSGEIVYNDNTCAFEMCYETTVGIYGEKATHKMLIKFCEKIEIIGNIHEAK